MFNFHTFELKDVMALLQQYNLEIQKPGYTLYGKYKGVSFFEGTISGRADDKITNVLMAYNLSTYNGEIIFTGNYYPITLESIEVQLKKLVEGYKLLEVALKKREIEKDFK